MPPSLLFSSLSRLGDIDTLEHLSDWASFDADVISLICTVLIFQPQQKQNEDKPENEGDKVGAVGTHAGLLVCRVQARHEQNILSLSSDSFLRRLTLILPSATAVSSVAGHHEADRPDRLLFQIPVMLFVSASQLSNGGRVFLVLYEISC
ncbi:hypothetical protein COCNU_07G002310 [Cocos nucifera]|uniref:Uncharacterized protein n=1 Tax=Cocos nucifera TaxID=13894 RepID=A0A8K0IER4_COCNU|nr:hypothetical protein COCNU_07G002310 [Cocos nucifera]